MSKPMTPKLRHRARVLKTIFPDVYREVDGYWVWWPQAVMGAWTAWDLKVAAELLDEANRVWDEEMAQYFGVEDPYQGPLCTGEHRPPQGPNEDIGQCSCGSLTYVMRPKNEQIGLHADDCSLPRRHKGYCIGGGSGHAPTEIVRGYWKGMDEDVAAARERFNG